MSHRVVLGAIVAVVWVASCGGKAKPEHGDRNDALDETNAQATSTGSATNGTSPGSDTQLSVEPTSAPSSSVNETPHTSTSAATVDSGSSGSGLTIKSVDPDDVTESPTVDAPDAGSSSVSSDSPSDEGTSGKACGARAGESCEANEYCAYVPGQLCGRADAEATCKLRPESCTADYNPVCGCDGKTYSNTCAAASAGAGVLDEGECEGSEPEPADCETIQCFRAITCAESCTSEVVQAGCCPCPEGLIDTFVECTDQAPEQ